MISEHVPSFGSDAAAGPPFHGYIAPRGLARLRALGAWHVRGLRRGKGTLASQMAERGWDVCGVDRDADGIAILRSRYPKARTQCIAVNDGPAALMAREHACDVVISIEVMEHLFSPRHLPRLSRVVPRPTGDLIATLPYHGYLKNIAIALSGKWDPHTAPWYGGHITFWIREALTRLLPHNGSRGMRSFGVGRLPFLKESMALVAEQVA